MNETGIAQYDAFQRTDSLTGPFLQAADAFLRTQIDQETYPKIMDREAGRAHPYAAAGIVTDIGKSI